MKKTLGLILVALLTVGLVGGYTLAYFSDIETSNDNTWTAGTLNLVVNAEDPLVTAVFTVDNANPGASGYGTWALNNNGTTAGFIDLSGILVANAENYNLATNEAEAVDDTDTSDATGVGELAANLDVVLFVDDGTGGGTPNNGIQDGTEATIYTGKLSAIAAAYDQDLPLAAAGTTYISMTWSVATTVNNTIMGDSAELDMTIVLDQTAD
jgi:predicted ribosomally synthesized peptide with SipW-like signal peptide